MKVDPLMDNIKEMAEFKRLFNQIEKKFWDRHKKIKVAIEEKKLL